MNNNYLSRRDFLKKTGKVALTGAAASLCLESLSGCAQIYVPFPEETRKDVAKINWDCNSALKMQ